MRIVPGIYQLRIRLRQPKNVRVGALGICHFPAGWYVYSGSAKNGLIQRIGRHLRNKKRNHWHIDYLLEVADDVEAFILPNSDVSECELHRCLQDGKTLVVGFGSSDCKCRSHLAYFQRKPRIVLMAWKKFILQREGLVP